MSLVTYTAQMCEHVNEHLSVNEKLLLEVAPTTLRLVLIIRSFQFSSAFPPRCRIWFSRFHSFTFSRKRNIFFLCPWTLTCELDVALVKMNHCAEVKGHFVQQLSGEHTHTADRLQYVDHKVLDHKVVGTMLMKCIEFPLVENCFTRTVYSPASCCAWKSVD